jgi:prevent-host-death family protein
MRTMAAGKFKAQCLGLIDEVKAKREPIIITKNGTPMVKMVPLEVERNEDLLAEFLFPGKVETHGDIVSPIYSSQELEEFFEQSLEPFR